MNKILFKLIEGKGRFFLNGDLKNGEIVNPELLHDVWQYIDETYFLVRDSKPLNDNDILDLPEGIGFEEQWQMALSSNPDSNYVDCNEDQLRAGFNSRKVIRLLPEPVQKEESQEDMWMDVFKLVDTNHTIEYLSELFTIKRKDS